MFALLNWRVWAAIVIAVALAMSHWKAYKLGGNAVRVEWDAYIAEQTKQAEAEQAKRLEKENALKLSQEKLFNDLAKQKSARAADAVAAGNRLRDFNAAADRAASQNPSAPGGANGTGGPQWDVLRQCAETLTGLGQTADRLEDKVVGLQAYVRDVCTVK